MSTLNVMLETDEEDANSKVCKICVKLQAKYTCPKCGINYCSLACYQSESHGDCSEDFYRQCILDEMKQEVGDTEAEERMKEILLRFQQSQHTDADVEELDSDDDCEVDLADRMCNVNLDDPDSVWEKLTTTEKEEFTELIKSGDVTELLPTWKPWWTFRKERNLVVEVESSASSNEVDSYIKNCPKLKENIQALSHITKTQPSPVVKYNVQNVLAAYCYVTRWFNGEHNSFATEAAQTLMSLSCNLSQGNNYSSADLATEAVTLQVTSCGWLDCSPESILLMRHDLRAVLAGPEDNNITFYLLAALSDIHALLSTASKSKAKLVKRDSEFSRQFPDYPGEGERSYFPREKLKQCAKKIEYYISWAKEHGAELCMAEKQSSHDEILTRDVGYDDR